MARLRGSINNDTINGYGDADQINGGYGNDTLVANQGDDTLNGGRGSDVLQGGEGNDVIISRSDAGEGAIAQDINATNDPNGEVDAATRRIYSGQQGLPADDVLTGGAGADEFRIETLINAKADILAKHADPNTGEIDYAGVAGENNLVHDHWVDGIGNDVITDFNKDEGDTLSIKGHTTEVFKIDLVDADGDGAADDSVLHLRSKQGGAGAHDQDLLGTLTVLNNAITADDFTTDAGATYGIVKNISQVNEAIAPLNPSGVEGDTGGAPAVGGTAGADGGAATGGSDGGSGTGYGSGTASGADSAAGAMGHGTVTHGVPAGAGAASGNGGSVGTTGSAEGASTGGAAVGAGAGASAGAGDGTGDANGPASTPSSGGPLGDLLSPPAGTASGQAATAGDDVLVYSSGNEQGRGGLGNDLLLGLDGNDTLAGGWGNDRIDGGAGDDHVHGGHGDDLIAGGAGADGLTGDHGDDILLGGDGGDEIRGGRGEDIVLGGSGNDVLLGGVGHDVLMGGAGADRINGGAGEDALLLAGTIRDYTIAVGADGSVQFTDTNGETDIVSRVEEFRFLGGTGETYVIEGGALVATSDTEDLDDLLHDHFVEELITAETGGAASVGAQSGAHAAVAPDTAAHNVAMPMEVEPLTGHMIMA